MEQDKLPQTATPSENHYKPLPKTVTKKGYLMTQMRRGTRAAMYSGSQDGDVLKYEVFHIKRSEGREFRGIKTEPAEYFPGDESFGSWAFVMVCIRVAWRRQSASSRR